MALLLEGHALEDPGLYSGFFCHGQPLDFLPPDGLLVVEWPWATGKEALDAEEKVGELRTAKERRGDVPHGFPSLHVPWDEVDKRLSSTSRRLDISHWTSSIDYDNGPPPVELGFLPSKSYRGRLDDLAKDVAGWQKDGDRVVMVSHYAARLVEVMQAQGVSVQVDGKLTKGLDRGSVGIVRGSLAEGMEPSTGRFHLPCTHGRGDYGTGKGASC